MAAAVLFWFVSCCFVRLVLVLLVLILLLLLSRAVLIVSF